MVNKLSLYFPWTWFVTPNGMIKAVFVSVGLKKLENVRLYYLKIKNCLA